jgi:hypothetical protein
MGSGSWLPDVVDRRFANGYWVGVLGIGLRFGALRLEDLAATYSSTS